MKDFAIAGLAAGAVAASTLALAGTAAAMPTGPTTVDQTVNSLHASGYQVIVNKVGAEPLDQCTVSGVRPGQTFARTDSGVPGAGSSVITTVTNKSVFVDVTC